MTDQELEQLADLFDQAMTSDNPTVKRAFRNLLMVAAIDNPDNAHPGPMRDLLNRVNRLETRISQLEQHQPIRPQSPFGPSSPYQPIVPNQPYTYPTPATWPNITYGTGTGNVPITAQGASSTAFDDQWAPDPGTLQYKGQ